MAMKAKLKTIAPPRVRRTVLRTRVALRYPASGIRSLPDFLIIGTQRGGTTSMFRYLSQHPRVLRSLRKEVEYFSRRYRFGERWYRSHFPLQARKGALQRMRKGPILTFEATPDYLFYPRAAERAAQLVPEAKIVVFLRNPVTRAYSHYQHMRRLGFENLSFEEAIEREDERVEPDLEAIRRDPLHYARGYLRFSYLARGFYLDQLGAWLEHYPSERVLILPSEAFFLNPQEGYEEVLHFLGLPDHTLPDLPNYSYAGGRRKAGTQMDPNTRSRLVEHFREPNQRLYAFLDRDLGWEA